MKLLLTRSNNSFIPTDDESVKIFSQIKEGEDVLVEYKKHRNVGNHRRLFSMLQTVVQNTDKYKNVDNLLSVIKLRSGHFDTIVTHRGDAVYIPKSINFASLGEDKFKEFFSQAIDICMEIVGDEAMESILRYC